MMDGKELTLQYDRAEGPIGLRDVLLNYHAQSQRDPVFARSKHYVLYVLGEQRSLIQVDTSSLPFHFRYGDLLGRPATQSVKKTLAQFLLEQCGEKAFSLFFEDNAKPERLAELSRAGIPTFPRQSVEEVFKQFQAKPAVTSQIGIFGSRRLVDDRDTLIPSANKSGSKGLS